MKLVFVSDVHGNIYAFEKFLMDIEKYKVDAVFFCGDIFGYYYHQNKIIDLLRRKQTLCKSLLGNHDKLFLDLLEGNISDESLIDKYGNSYKDIVDKISQANIAYLKSLPEKIELDIQNKKIVLCHGSLEDNLNGRIYPDTSIENAELYTKYDYVILGHTHHKMVRKIRETYIINPGSIGQQRDGKGCSYLILDLDKNKFEFKIIEYDLQKLVSEINYYDDGNERLKEVLIRKRGQFEKGNYFWN